MAAAAPMLAAATTLTVLRMPHAPRRDPVDGALQVVRDVSHDLALRREHGLRHQLQEFIGRFAEEAVYQVQASAASPATVHSEAVAAEAGRAAVRPFLRARFWRFWWDSFTTIGWNSPTAGESCSWSSHLQPLLQWVAV